MSNGSGDYAVAFSTFPGNRIPHGARAPLSREVLPNGAMTPLLVAVIDATEEAVLNSLLAADTTRGREGHVAQRIDPQALRRP